jgi:hypothetical protein
VKTTLWSTVWNTLPAAEATPLTPGMAVGVFRSVVYVAEPELVAVVAAECLGAEHCMVHNPTRP